MLRAGGITYIPTGEGRPRLMTAIDAWLRKVVGWSMSHGMMEDLAIDAINRAAGRECSSEGHAFHGGWGVWRSAHPPKTP